MRETEAWMKQRLALGRPESLGFWILLEDDLWDPDLPNIWSEIKAGPPFNALNWGSSLFPNCQGMWLMSWDQGDLPRPLGWAHLIFLKVFP